jgi:tetratricopeptide (TPR) repeat protein
VNALARSLIALLVVCALAVSCGKERKANTDNPRTAADYVARATKSFLDKDNAIKDLDKAIELDDACTQAYKLRAEIYEGRYTDSHRSKDAECAIADYDALMKLEPKAAQAVERLRRRAWLKIQIEAYDEAITDLEAARAKKKNEPKTYEYLAQAYIGKDDLPEAAKYYGYAIKYDPNNASLYKQRARVYYSMDKKEKAIPDLEHVTQMQPDVEAYHALAQILLELGRNLEAFDYYEKARELDPTIEDGSVIW